MSESQSRYSIVERLTTTKIGLIDQRSQIDRELAGQEQGIKSLEKDLAAYAKEATEDTARETRKKEKQIEESHETLKFNKGQKTEKLTAIDEKIKQIDKALTAIEEISKVAPKPEEQT